MLNWTVFREYDVRGIADTELTDEFAYSLGRAYGAALRAAEGRTVAVGRDVRDSSPRLVEALGRGLTDSGLTVFDVGIVPTPGLYFAVVHLPADGGVMVTGSHNPIEYNGFKMQIGTASLHGEEIRALGERIERKAFVDGTGTREERPIAADYVAMIVGKCRPVRPLKIVLDAGNGVAGPPALEVFRALGHDVVPLYCEPDGRFPNHQPDPTVEKNMRDLMAKVKEVGADLGCGYDGDADRIGVVDEKGRLLWGDQLLALLAREVLQKRPGSKIVFDVKCSQGLEEDIRAHGDPGHVEDRSLLDQGQNEGGKGAAGRRCRDTCSISTISSDTMTPSTRRRASRPTLRRRRRSSLPGSTPCRDT
ncbi:MAG: phosphomannomutase/phosphoglucomutase [Candidatus Eisenbacteria bacterium]